MSMSNLFANVEIVNSYSTQDLNHFLDQPVWKNFSNEVIEFLEALSKELRDYNELRLFPDIAAFAFFCRGANLLSLVKQYESNKLVVGRGLIFHLTPSNVPVNFAFSWVAGLLTGNINIVRLPSETFKQVDIIVEAINKISDSDAFTRVVKRSLFIRYEKHSQATKELSAICDIRIIWGGDSKIFDIRKFPLKAKSYDIPFADRYSLSVFHTDGFYPGHDFSKLARLLYNDALINDQNACTSPHLILWIGPEDLSRNLRLYLWSELNKLVEERLQQQPNIALDKLNAFCIQSNSFKIKRLEPFENNNLWFVELLELNPGLEEFKCHSGYFLEFFSQNLDDIKMIVSQKYQTLSYFGFERDFLIEHLSKLQLSGIDRVVQIGRGQEFSLFWDGYDLVRMLTRTVDVN
jgi:hypothetical protein